jgi:hypothetical protein
VPTSRWFLCRAPIIGLALSFCVGVAVACGARSRSAPAQLSDEEFWNLSTRLSEPPGVFRHSENLVSNEELFPHTIRLLRARGGVYIGVGPEQNFSYIARIRPAMAFIIDIRQENRNLHLLYKALFEASANRLEFVSRLFSREVAAAFDAGASAQDLFAAIDAAAASSSRYDATADMVRNRLLDTHGLPLPAEDLRSIEYALKAFYLDGPGIHYARLLPKDTPGPSYRALMTASDARGVARSYLATEDAFAFVKNLHTRNLIVPIVGDFSGPSAMKGVGDYARQRASVVSAFYSSNVEVYLTNQQMTVFCTNLAALPYESGTWFIGSKGLRPLTSKVKACAPGLKPSV